MNTRKPIRLHEPRSGNGFAKEDQKRGRQRLNLFAGRSLGEREFDILQDYSDSRLAPLLYGHPPGILHGFEVTAGMVPMQDSEKTDWLFRIRPGLAVGGDGKIINMIFPLDQYWQTQKADYLDSRSRGLNPLSSVNGIYFLTLKRTLENVDKNGNFAGCVRDELDMLRDSRIETATSLTLQIVWEGDAAVTAAKADKTLTINRLLADHLHTDWFAADGAVPIGMLAVEDDTILWFDVVAGRFPAKADANYWTFLSHSTQSIQQHFHGQRIDDDTERQALIASFKLAYLPAAGVLPTLFLNDVAVQPKLSWFPDHLQIEMAPIAESQVEALIGRELARTSIDLQKVGGDRIRLLLAVSDADYRADLLDLPFPDANMQHDLYRYAQKAFNSWKDWVVQYDVLFNKLATSDFASAEGQRLFSSIPERIDTEAEGQPIVPNLFFERLIQSSRDWQTSTVGSSISADLPAPYSEVIPAPPADLVLDFNQPAANTADGLLKQYLDTSRSIDETEALIDDLADLLTLYADMQRSQRQQLDHVSLSFTHLAGGVQGDGSGLTVARWLPSMQFATKIKPVPQDN